MNTTERRVEVNAAGQGRPAAIGAVISALLTGGVAALFSYPTQCTTLFRPFSLDCRNLLGFSSLADYPIVATGITAVAALMAGLVVFFMLRSSDND